MKRFPINTSTLLFISLTGILVVISFISFNKIIQYNKSVDLLMHSNLVKSKINEAFSSLKDGEIGQRGYLITNDSVFLEPFTNAEKQSDVSFATLDSLIGDKSEQKENLKKLKSLIDQRYILLNSNLVLLNKNLTSSRKNAALLKGKLKMDEVRHQVDKMVQNENDYLKQGTLEKDRTANITPIFLLALSLLSILIITLFFFRLRTETRMRISSEEAEKLLDEKVKRRTRQLTERNIFIETLIDSSIDLIIVFDKKLRYLTMNKIANISFENNYIESVIGKKMDEVDPRVHETGAYASALSALNGNIVFQKESKIFSDQRYYDIDYIPLKNEREIYGVMTIIRDVTESVLAASDLKKINATLEKRNNFVETILEISKEYIVVFAKDFTLIDCNKATENLMGKKRNELIGFKLLEIHPSAKGSKSETDLEEAFKGSIIQNEPFLSKGTGRYIENYIHPLKDSKGEIYAALVVGNDVTNIILKQKEFEAANNLLKLRNQTFVLAERSAKFGSYKWNISTGELEYSDNLFRLLDCEIMEFVPTYEKFLSFIHPEDLENVISNGLQTLKSGSLVETPYRIISKTGEIKHFRSSGRFDNEGENLSLIGTVQDISYDVTLSRELKAKNTELENTNAELASFSYVASHDLQEPLRKIQAFSKRIIDKEAEGLSENGKDYLKRIVAAAQRMQNLIESLLNLSQTNISDVVFEKTDLNQILIDVQTVLNEKISSTNAVIKSQTLPILNAVPIQMHQLFFNLIGNSLKYSKPDIAPEINITVEKIEPNKGEAELVNNGAFWKIEIKDNGIGFEQNYQNKIFELFQRLHGKTEYEGTGIGLAICKKIVKIHNGTISASGEPNVGATITILLPDANIA